MKMTKTMAKAAVTERNEKEDSSKATAKAPIWTGLAMFGESGWALAASFALLVVAVGIALTLDEPAAPTKEDAYAALPPIPSISPPIIHNVKTDGDSLVTKKIRDLYERDGVVAIRGLLTPQQLDLLEIASNELVQDQESKNKGRGRKRSGTQFHSVHVGVVFLETPDKNGSLAAFRDVALFSNVPKFAAELLQLDKGGNETIRLLRDIFLTKDEDAYICGWHVDDTGFWPATAAAPGVNAWIAIDDMPVETGGGFALAVKSHKEPWRWEAHKAIGSVMTFPAEGFRDAEDLFRNRAGSGTCNLKTAAPHLHRRMEETKRIYDIRHGDVIFHDRWLFHRTVPFNRSVVKSHPESLLYKRYSVRYSPGSAVIPKGYGTELSVLWDEANGGRTADEVAAKDGPWYPLCWPSVSMDEMAQMVPLINEKMPVAEQRRTVRKEEMKPYRIELGKRKGHSTKV